MKTLTAYVLFAALPIINPVVAQEPVMSDDFSIEKLFHSDQLELTANAGAMFSPFVATAHRPTLNYALGGLQVGWMITDLNSAGALRGNWEMAPEIFGGEVFSGRGSYIAGSTLWFRYNFVPGSCRVIPYAQAGGGFVFANVDERIVSQDFNFNLGLAAGFRWLFTQHLSLNLEYRFQHISNANLAHRNVGINAQGPTLGVSYFF